MTADTLNRYLDGELDPEEAADIEARMEAEPALRAEFEALARQDALIREAADGLDTGPANPRTAALTRRLAAALPARRRVPSRVVVFPQWPMQIAAAAALVAFGWWGSQQVGSAHASVPAYVERAMSAHTVFAQDLDYPVEYVAAELPARIYYLSDKLGAEVPEIDLRDLGYDFLGARVVSAAAEPALLYLYEDAEGDRLSLLLSKHPADEPLHDLEVVDYPGSQVGYWGDAEFDYAMVTKPGAVDYGHVAALLAR